jgi:beta-glucanase (GH16 family)
VRVAPIFLCVVLALVAAPVAGATGGPTRWRVVVGPEAVRDALGQRWTADTRARGGRLVRMGRGTIGRTASPRLYRVRRDGIRSLRLPVGKPGTYGVVLRFVAGDGGARGFDVLAEGATVAAGVDPAAAAGGPRNGWPLALRTVVADGALDLDFLAAPGATTTLSAVEVRRLSPSTAPLVTTWGDDFLGAAGAPVADARWDYYVGVGSPVGWGAGELQTYTYRPQNVGLTGDGALAITARRERHADEDGHPRAYTSGRIGTDGRFAFTYGLLSARLRLPAGKGIWPAFWLLGDDVDRVGWPAAGEIDVAELMGSAPSMLYGSVHGPRPAPRARKPYNINRTTTTAAPLDGDFHVYSVLRFRGVIQLLLDGRPYQAYTPEDLGPGRPWVYDKPFRIMLNLAVGGVWDGAPDVQTPFPATLLADWIRLEKWAPSASPAPSPPASSSGTASRR